VATDEEVDRRGAGFFARGIGRRPASGIAALAAGLRNARSKTSGIIPTAGHTPGHHALLVHLASGTVLLSGDQYHFTENRRVGGVPGFNRDRADTLASHDRFEKLATNAKAKVVIQHEPADVAKLPTFPKAAE
jgi:glyoxylase-like metal-dependent hydrolase (beta-lactamase superfamily II)